MADSAEEPIEMNAAASESNSELDSVESPGETESSDQINPDIVNADEVKPSDGIESEQLASELDTKSPSETLPSEEVKVDQVKSSLRWIVVLKLIHETVLALRRF